MTINNDFSKGSILAHMARIALPMTLAQFVNILYNIIDRVFIGRIPEHATDALTGLEWHSRCVRLQSLLPIWSEWAERRYFP